MELKPLYPIHRKKHREAAKLKRQRNMAQMKEQTKTPEKELSNKDIANLSDAEFKTLVVRMLRDVTEYGKCIREEMKATLSEIRKNPKGIMKRRKPGFKSVIGNIRKK